MAVSGDGHTSGFSDPTVIIALGELDVCDGDHRCFVMIAGVNEPAQAKLGRGTLLSGDGGGSPGHPPNYFYFG